MKGYLGVDVGSVSTKFALLDENNELVNTLYLLTQG
jgi:activator of 2-hydroxyglutaryl-CoA dehydratase